MDQYAGDYCVDIVMCIDATGSMAPIINEVKENALSFYEKVSEAMSDNQKEIAELRVKVIAFRDFMCDSKPIEESEFFVLPDQARQFRDFVSRIEAAGGGDTAENALEAVALAFKSKWTKKGKKRRHVIMVFTDAPALKPGERSDCPGYPSNMPSSLAQLGSWWEGTDQMFISDYEPRFGRLIAFAPAAYPWIEINSWNRYWSTISPAGTGLSNLDISSAIDLLVGSC